MSTITRTHPGRRTDHEEPIEAFFARRGRKVRRSLPPFALSEVDLLADLDPGRLAWREAGHPAPDRPRSSAFRGRRGRVRAPAG